MAITPRFQRNRFDTLAEYQRGSSATLHRRRTAETTDGGDRKKPASMLTPLTWGPLKASDGPIGYSSEHSST